MKRSEAYTLLAEITAPVLFIVPEVAMDIVMAASRVASDIREGRAEEASMKLLASIRASMRAHRGCLSGPTCRGLTVIRHANAMRHIAISVHREETFN